MRAVSLYFDHVTPEAISARVAGTSPHVPVPVEQRWISLAIGNVGIAVPGEGRAAIENARAIAAALTQAADQLDQALAPSVPAVIEGAV